MWEWGLIPGHLPWKIQEISFEQGNWKIITKKKKIKIVVMDTEI